MEEKNEKNKEIDSNENILDTNKKEINLNQINKYNYGELTKEQFELMKKIRDETIHRTEKYSDLINEEKSNDIFLGMLDNNKKKKKNKIKKIDNVSIQTNNNTEDILEYSQKEEINPNKERIYNTSQPFLFFKGEPFIVLGPDTIYFVWIFSIVSFLSIIIYSLKNSHIFFQILFIFGYLFFAVNYILLLIINPGMPSNKSKLDPSMLQKHYRQCQYCNCISFEQDGNISLHCDKCKVCIEDFDHHCTFATKCIGRGNAKLFKTWIYSIAIFFVISFLYLIF